MNLQLATYKVIYNSKDITADISDHLLSLTYTDKVEGESDELEIELEDKEGVWQDAWYPGKKATIEAEIISNDIVLPCGRFTIDEIKLSGDRSGGDKITISCLAAGITKKLRTKVYTAHENKTLQQLAQSVAVKHGLTIQGTIPSIRFSRITQHHETDLGFLNRLAIMYGLIFSVRDTLLIFQNRTELENKAHVLSLDKTEIMEYDFTDKSEQTYKSANVKYHNPESNETIDFEALSDDPDVSEDALTIREKAETKQQAELMAGSQLSRNNTKEKTTAITCPGNPLLLSGSNTELTGFGKLSGIYHITESKHSISRSDGYEVAWEGKKVKSVDVSKHKPKKIKSNSPANALSIAGSRATTAVGFALNTAGAADD